MEPKIGIPQALLFYEFGRFWTSFFANLGLPVILSGNTNKLLLDRGVTLAIDESCLPLKIYLGHVSVLLDKCDFIFVPRITQYHHNFFLCPKFAGLPDIVRNAFHVPETRLLTPNIDSPAIIRQRQAVYTLCRQLGVPYWRGEAAYLNALPALCQGTKKELPERAIAVVGHSYLVHDTFFCQSIMNTIQAGGFTVLIPEQLPVKCFYQEAQAFSPDIYWQFSAKIAGAVRYFSRQPQVTGLIMVSSFNCGPDSLLNEYLEHHVLQPSSKPYTIINLDEHTGNTGIVTRIEAFVDLVNWGLRS